LNDKSLITKIKDKSKKIKAFKSRQKTKGKQSEAAYPVKCDEGAI
jgi:hypothetical protein